MSTRIQIAGAVRSPASLSDEDLGRAPEQVPDVAALMPDRQGTAVRLGALLDAAGPLDGATHVTLTAEGGKFKASVPIAHVRQALIVYRLGDGPLPRAMGGPFRFLIPDAKSCRDTSLPVDRCANVKFLERIEVTRGEGEDTRPSEEERDRRHGKAGHRASVARSEPTARDRAPKARVKRREAPRSNGWVRAASDADRTPKRSPSDGER